MMSDSVTNDTMIPPGVKFFSCQQASEVVLHPYAQFARIMLILFNAMIYVVFVLLFVEYKHHRFALHANLKLLYINIVLTTIFSSFGYFLVEFRHLYLTLADPHGSQPCAMLCPLWFALLSRGFGLFQGFSTPIFHFLAMWERWRATRMARNYEKESPIWMVLIVYVIISFLYYRRYILTNGSGRHQQSTEVAPLEQMGQLYFKQLESQWNDK